MFKLVKNMTKDNITEMFCYVNLLFNFIGVGFLNFTILNVNLNLGRILMILAVIPFFMSVRKIGFKNLICENVITVKRVLIFLIVWSLFSLTSFFNAKDLFSTIIYEFFFIFGTINILLLVSIIDNQKKLINIFKIIEISAIINAILVLYVYFFCDKLQGAFYGNVNDLSTFFLIAIPIQLFLLHFDSNKKSINLIRTIMLFILLYTFWILDSRACKIGFMTGAVFMIFFAIYKKSIKLQNVFIKIYSNKKMFIILVTLVCVIMGLACCVVAKEFFIPKTTNLDSNAVRVNLIYNAFYFLKDNFFFGVGSGNIRYYLENYSIYPTKNILNMHNYWIEILVDYGIFIFVAFVISYFSVFIGILIKYINSKKQKDTYMYFTILFFMGSFIFGSVSSSINITKEWLWLVTGIVIAILNMEYKISKFIERKRVDDGIQN